MTYRFFTTFLLLAYCATGCIQETAEPSTPPPDVKNMLDVGKLPEDILAEARLCEKNQNYLEAAKKYALVSEKTYVHAELEESVLGHARVLALANEPEAALIALNPLDEDPTSFFECQKLALVGEILNQKSDYETAESAFEVALGKCPRTSETERFRAENFAKLGQVYMHNEKYRNAIRVFTVAEQLYNKNNCKEQAKACREIISYIKSK